MSGESSDFVDLRTFHDMHELEEVLALLESEGIPAYAPGRSVAGMYPGFAEALFQVPLRVARDRADEARDLIEAFLEAEPQFVDFPDGVDFPGGAAVIDPQAAKEREEGRRTVGRLWLLWMFGPLLIVLYWLLGEAA